MMKLPYAEDVGHYWKTSQSPPDVWLERTKKVVVDLGGRMVAEGYGSTSGRAAFMLAFEIQERRYKVVWPVLPSFNGQELAAKRQAATMLFHDIKAKAMAASVLGAQAAFFSYMMLPDGRVSSELAAPELAGVFPKLLT